PPPRPAGRGRPPPPPTRSPGGPRRRKSARRGARRCHADLKRRYSVHRCPRRDARGPRGRPRSAPGWRSSAPWGAENRGTGDASLLGGRSMRAFSPRRLIVCATLAACLASANPAQAGPPTEMLRGVFNDANRVLTDPNTEQRPLERLIAIRALFSRVFDFRDAAERSLGRQWQVRTSAEQQEFTRLFADFVQRGFVYWLASVAEVDGRAGGATVQFISETVDRDTATVQTAILARGGRLIPLTH